MESILQQSPKLIYRESPERGSQVVFSRIVVDEVSDTTGADSSAADDYIKSFKDLH